MKAKKKTWSALLKLLTVVIMVILSVPSVAFAADPIEVTYSGGSRVDEVARVDSYEVEHLYKINRDGLVNTVYIGGPWTERKWQNTDRLGKSITIPTGTKVWSGTGFICESDIVVDGEYYDLKLNVVKTVNNTGHQTYLWKRYNGTYLDLWPVDGSSTPDNLTEGVFVSCDVEIVNHVTGEPLQLGDLRFCISDLDCSQSFTSSNIDFSPSNLLIKKTGQFPGYAPEVVGRTAGDAYVNSTGIYYTPWADATETAAGDGADVFMDVSGLEKYNIVFGFHSSAGSPIHFFTTKNTVEYKSINGTITGRTSELVLKGGSPLGSSQTPDENHTFRYWTADVPVLLSDGESISSGTPLTEEQIKSVNVIDDVVFTAYNDPSFTIETEAVNGVITPAEKGIPAGENRRIIYAPDKGYQLRQLTADDIEMDISEYPSSYPFEDINDDHFIKAEFEKTPALEVTKTADRKVYAAGEKVTYTVKVRQTVEGAEARGVVVKDTLPEGLTLDTESITGDVKVVNADDGSYELSIDSLTEELVYTYTAVTPTDADAEELINVVTVSAENVPGNPEKDWENVRSYKAKPSISKMASNSAPILGEEITYTISVKESQEGLSIKNAVVTDAIPEGLEVKEGSLETSGDPAEASIENGVISVTIPELGGETVIKYSAMVTAESGTIVNTAKMTGDGISELEDSEEITIKDRIIVEKKTVEDKGKPDDPEKPAVPAAEKKQGQGENKTVDNEKPGRSPATGDDASVKGLVAGAVLVMLSLSVMILVLRRRAERQRGD